MIALSYSLGACGRGKEVLMLLWWCDIDGTASADVVVDCKLTYDKKCIIIKNIVYYY